MRYCPNSSLYEAGGRLRYIQRKMVEKTPSYFTVFLEKTDYLAATLQRAVKGEQFERLAEALVGDEESLEDAVAYIDKVISNEVLVPEFSGAVTGAEPLLSLQAGIRWLAGGDPFSQRQIQVSCVRASSSGQGGPGSASATLRELIKRIGVIPAAHDFPSIFQVDLAKPVREASLGQAVLREIERGVELLRHLIPWPQSTEVSRFRDAFVARYEEKEVPLLEALDQERGIGFHQVANAGQSPLDSELFSPESDSVRWVPARSDCFARRAAS
jgi:hypothetical protein